ncbi:MAG: 4Fe-4S dicluster domain-containing protein, partial [Candidatus Muiribacteriota bacterium]
PEGGIPLNIGVIVNNVETVYRVYNALENKKPFTKRYVTVTGDINKPFVAEIPVGVSFSHILELAGKKPGLNYIAVDGGPMMGKITEVDKGFIKKTTSGIIFLDKKSILIQRKTQNIKNVISQAAATCCNCVTCTDLCSRYLIGHKMEPHKIMRAIFNQNLDNKLFETAFLCSECNICELYACPLNLSPRTVNVFLKDEYRKKGKRPEWDKRELSAPEFREGRLVPSERLINRLGLGSFSKIKPDFREKVEIPEKLYIFTNSHIGAPAEICVKQGDSVLKNQNIAVKNGNVSANYHSPTDGIVSEVQENLIVIEVKK